MADLQASCILQPGDPIFGRVTLAKKTAATNIQKGDFVKLTTGEIEVVSGATDDATFLGVCSMKSEDADGPTNLLIYTQCIVECPMESAAYAFGAGLKYNTNGTLEADGSANTIAFAWETKGTTTSLKVLVDVIALGKLFTVSA